MFLNVALALSVATGNRERDIPLNELIFKCQLVRLLNVWIPPRVLKHIPLLFHFIIDPLLKVLLLVIGEAIVLPSHDCVMEEHATVEVALVGRERRQGVDDLLFLTTGPQIRDFGAQW
jgi:hypothetical protein